MSAGELAGSGDASPRRVPGRPARDLLDARLAAARERQRRLAGAGAAGNPEPGPALELVGQRPDAPTVVHRHRQRPGAGPDAPTVVVRHRQRAAARRGRHRAPAGAAVGLGRWVAVLLSCLALGIAVVVLAVAV